MAFRIQENAMRDITSITISLASPDDILTRSYGGLQNRKQLIIVLSALKRTDFSAKKYSGPRVTGNVSAASIKE